MRRVLLAVVGVVATVGVAAAVTDSVPGVINAGALGTSVHAAGGVLGEKVVNPLGVVATTVGVAAVTGPVLRFSVPGVINAGTIGTYISCTSTSPTTQTVTVNIFDQDGVASGTGTISLLPNNTVMFGTRNANGVLADVITGAVGTSKGYAQILSTSALLMCTAFVSDVVHLTPMGMTSLNVIKGTTQQGE